MQTSIALLLAAASAASAAVYSTAPQVYTTPTTTGSTYAVPTSARDKCDTVWDDCVASYTSQGQSPFFPECNSRRAACQAGSSYSTGPVPTFPAASTTTSSVIASQSYSAQCQNVWDQCIASYTSQGQSPFFPECNSRRAACQAGSSYSTGPVPTFPAASTTTSSVTASESYSAKCQDVWNKCIESYTSQGQSPFFPECNSQRAACQGGSGSSTTSCTTLTSAVPASSSHVQTTSKASSMTTTSNKPSSTTSHGIATYTGAATAPQAPFFGVLAAGAVLALL